MRAELLIEEAGNDVILWSHPPFFDKSPGAGVLLLGMGEGIADRRTKRDVARCRGAHGTVRNF
jgi:hypothetical protein